MTAKRGEDERKGDRMTAGEIQPVRLRCEYRTDPLEIDKQTPRLSWMLEAEGRGQIQSAYRVLVADSEEDLRNEKNLLWDSGKVDSDQTINVLYDGKDLSSSIRCYWKVRVWNENDESSSYSEPAMWGMGLLHQSDWAGKWVGLGEGTTEGLAPPFR